MKATEKRTCPVCNTLLDGNSDVCPVCALKIALESENHATATELRFEHYQVLKNEDGTPVELGHGAMGVTFKAVDVHLQGPVAVKIINARLIGDASARQRFVREARAAASVRHPNVASVFHLGESGGNYYYAMEFVDGETLERLIRRSGNLPTHLALEVVAQITAGLTAIHKQHLVHRDIKPSNIMVNFEEDRLETVKIIDLGLAKGVAEETISTVGGFTGTPEYASPEQFAGVPTDIRSDLYSLGITLWEMLSGKLPFQGSAVDLMYQHQRGELPVRKLGSAPVPIVALLKILLAKDPGDRFQNPAGLTRALAKVKEAIASGSHPTANDLRAVADPATEPSPKKVPRKHVILWLLAAALGLATLLFGSFFFLKHQSLFFTRQSTQPGSIEKSIAVLPFENISANKDDAYFADGVQDEILNNLAKIAQLKVISRTSVMQYRADTKRDLRQIASALGVANVLEGTVRRDGNHVRVSTELVDASDDKTIWADSYDRDLTDIFAIQSEVAQAIANKLTATISPEERKWIEAKPTDNLEAYDLYLRANELIQSAKANGSIGNVAKPYRDAIPLLEHAVRLDPKFTLAYCAAAVAHSDLYHYGDQTSERRASADAAMNSALRLQPDLPKVCLTYARYLYHCYRDYERARVQLAIARRGMPNSSEAITLEAFMDRRQGDFHKAIQGLDDAIKYDPRNAESITALGDTLFWTRQFDAAQRAYDRLIELAPDQPMFRVQRAYFGAMKSGDDTELGSALAAVPTSMSGDIGVLSWRLRFALNRRDWQQAKELIER